MGPGLRRDDVRGARRKGSGSGRGRQYRDPARWAGPADLNPSFGHGSIGFKTTTVRFAALDSLMHLHLNCMQMHEPGVARMTTKLTLVSHKLCPYVQRAVIALTEKAVPFERLDIDLADKPAWFK